MNDSLYIKNVMTFIIGISIYNYTLNYIYYLMFILLRCLPYTIKIKLQKHKLI